MSGEFAIMFKAVLASCVLLSVSTHSYEHTEACPDNEAQPEPGHALLQMHRRQDPSQPAMVVEAVPNQILVSEAVVQQSLAGEVVKPMKKWFNLTAGGAEAEVELPCAQCKRGFSREETALMKTCSEANFQVQFCDCFNIYCSGLPEEKASTTPPAPAPAGEKAEKTDETAKTDVDEATGPGAEAAKDEAAEPAKPEDKGKAPEDKGKATPSETETIEKDVENSTEHATAAADHHGDTAEKSGSSPASALPSLAIVAAASWLCLLA